MDCILIERLYNSNGLKQANTLVGSSLSYHMGAIEISVAAMRAHGEIDMEYDDIIVYLGCGDGRIRIRK
jgi:hypothetical protein